MGLVGEEDRMEGGRMNAHSRARVMIEDHPGDCAREVLAWRRTGTLPDDAKLREVGKIYSEEGFSDELQQAEQAVCKVALERMAFV